MEPSDKSAVAKARRYLGKGQYDRALAEYDALLREEPFNAAILKELAEVHVGLGNTGEAKSTLLSGAERFAKKGLFREVISLYKQLLKLDPFLSAAYIKLYEILSALGMRDDAQLINKGAVELFQSAGALEELVRLLEKIIELDREDYQGRMALADTCLKLQRTDLAMVHYENVLPLLRKNKLDDLFIDVAEHIIYYKPENLSLCKELAVLRIRRGEPTRAEKLLLYCYLHAPEDIETLDLLTEHFLAAGKTGKAVSVLLEKAKHLADSDESKKAVDVIKIVLDYDPENEEARRFLQRAAEKKAKEKKSGRRKTPPPGAYARVSSSSQARISLPPLPGEGSSTKGVQALAQEDLRPHELVLFIRGAEIFPESPAIKEKLKDVYVRMGQDAEAIELLYSLAEPVMEEDPEKARTYLQEILRLRSDEKKAGAMIQQLGLPQRPTKKVLVPSATAQADGGAARKGRVSRPPPPDAPPEETPGGGPSKPWAREMLEEFSTDESSQGGAGRDSAPSQDDRRTNPIPSQEEITGPKGMARQQKKLQQMLGLTSSKMSARAPSHYEIGIAYYEMGQWNEAITEFLKAAAKEPDREALCQSLIGNCWSKLGDYDKAIGSFTTALKAKGVTDEQVMGLHYDLALTYIRLKSYNQALGSLEKVKSIDPEYKNVGAWIVAVSRMMDKAMGDRSPALTLIPSSLADVQATTGAAALQAAARPRAVEKPQEAVKTQAAVRPPEPAKSQTAARPQAVEKPQVAAKPQPAAKPTAVEKPQEAARPKEAAKLQPPAKPPAAARPTAAARPPQAAEEIPEEIPVNGQKGDRVLMKGISRSEIGADAPTHFDLGIAFMKMEQWKEAIEEFIKASGDNKIRGMCYNFMGNCFYNMGETEKAIQKYKTGLLSKDLTLDQKANLCYDLAESYLKQDNLRQALNFLERIQKLVPNYMDVNERINAITHYIERHPEKK